MRALRRFTVRAALPDALAQLGDIVMNLRWSWHPESLDLFEAVDPATWTAVGHDPLRLLGEVDPERLAELAGDRRFLRRLADAYDDGCRVQIQRIGPWLLIEDNGVCGGSGATFVGLYRRTK